MVLMHKAHDNMEFVKDALRGCTFALSKHIHSNAPTSMTDADSGTRATALSSAWRSTSSKKTGGSWITLCLAKTQPDFLLLMLRQALVVCLF